MLVSLELNKMKKMKVETYIEKSSTYEQIIVGRNLERELNKELSTLKLNYFQSLLLVALYMEEGLELTTKNLSNLFPLTKGGLSQALSVLESNRMIKRKTLDDKRKSALLVTTIGKEIALKVISIIEVFERKIEERV